MTTGDARLGADRTTVAGTDRLAPSVALGVAVLGAGLTAGFFVTYQISIIPGLAAVDDATYVRAFQALNERTLNPWFYTMLLGTPIAIAAALITNRRSSKAVRRLLGGGLVLCLAWFAITAVGNVPLNEELARQQPASAQQASDARSRFETPWNQLHLVRTLATVGSFALVTAAALRPRESRACDLAVAATSRTSASADDA